MSPLFLQQRPEVKKNVAFPFITIALSIHATREQLEQKIKLSIMKVGQELSLIEGISDYMVVPALDKLKSIFSTLENSSAYKKSVVIFLAPFIEKVFYLTFSIQEKVVVGDSLNFRELMLTKKEEKKYLVLNIKNDKCQIYHGEGKQLKLIVFNSSEHLKSYFSTDTEKFFSHVDNVLTHILKSYSLPLIVVGTEKIVSHFKSISKNSNEISNTIFSTYPLENVEKVWQLITPFVENFKKLKESYLLRMLTKAIPNKRAEIGINAVSKTLRNKRGKLLIVERDFYCSFRYDNINTITSSQTVSSNGLLGNDAVEDAIECTFAIGANVEFVESGVLKDFMQISLIV